MKRHSLRWYMFLSIATALLTMGVKFVGYALTGSVGLFSDAAESVVNLVAALVGLWAVTLAARPADEDHTYGHTKAEYFSSGVEGAWTVLRGHALCEEIELALRTALPESSIFTHLEPQEDPTTFQDIELERAP